MKQNAEDFLNASEILSPFRSDFDPSTYSKSKSHFHLAFCSIRERARKQSVYDFYAFCRLADDLADEEQLPLSARKEALDEIRRWLIQMKPTSHPFWDRLRSALVRSQVPPALALQILDAVETDMHPPVRMKTWEELNEYAQGVAGDVGEIVLYLTGAWSPKAPFYAKHMGRCVQYLNIMRDLETDLQSDRIYVPEDFLKANNLSPSDRKEDWQFIRDELFKRALESRSLARPYSWKCFPAEMMVNLYIQVAQKFWKTGKSRKLSKIEKIKTLIKAAYRSLLLLRKSSTC